MPDPPIEIDAGPLVDSIAVDEASGGLFIVGGLRALAGFAGFANTLDDPERRLVMLELGRETTTVNQVFEPRTRVFMYNAPHYEQLDTLWLWAGVINDSTQLIELRALKFVLLD
jgi:hypothetical protein